MHNSRKLLRKWSRNIKRLIIKGEGKTSSRREDNEGLTLLKGSPSSSHEGIALS